MTTPNDSSPKLEVSGEWTAKPWDNGRGYVSKELTEIHCVEVCIASNLCEDEVLSIVMAHNQSLALVTAWAEEAERQTKIMGKTAVEEIDRLRSENQKLREALVAETKRASARYCGNCDLGHQEDDCTCGPVFAKPQPSRAVQEQGDVLP